MVLALILRRYILLVSLPSQSVIHLVREFFTQVCCMIRISFQVRQQYLSRVLLLFILGDGICCTYGQGQYSITMDNAVVAQGGEFGSSETVTFGTCDAIPTPPVRSPSYSWLPVNLSFALSIFVGLHVYCCIPTIPFSPSCLLLLLLYQPLLL